MIKPIISFYNMETEETIEREMNKNEFDAYQIELQLQAEQKAEAEAKATQKAALLDRLGITEAEARLLLG